MKKYENFVKAYENLAGASDIEPPYQPVTMAGLVGLFEITFEQAWKMMKELLSYHGYSESATGSPRTVIKTAFSAGMISDEQAWLDLLGDRNNVAHSYNEKIAESIIQNTRKTYLSLFKKLRTEIENNWLS